MSEGRLSATGWIEAAAECLPRLKVKGLLELRSRLGERGRGVWTGGIGSGEGFSSVGLRYSGQGEDFARWLNTACRVLGLRGPSSARPPEGAWPWLELWWNAETGRLRRASLLLARSGAGKVARWTKAAGAAPSRSLLDRGPFSAGLFHELGLEASFSQFERLCPVRELISESVATASGSRRAGSAWALALRDPAPWPWLLRLDVAAPLAAASSQLSFLLLNRKVAELAFTRESMWAWLSD